MWCHRLTDVGRTNSMEVSDVGILVRTMHCAPHDGLTVVAASSIILEVKLSVFLTNCRYDPRKMILNTRSNSW